MKLVIILSFAMFFSCKSSQFEKTVPFQIKKAIYTNWVGGQPGVRGIKFEFLITNVKDNITFENLYFNKNKVKLYKRNSDKNTLLTANINTASNIGLEMIMHKDANKEHDNKLPKNKTDHTFKLKENEAVISFLQNGKEKFYKLMLTNTKDVFYP